jgi:hypothetical protein
MIIDRRQDNQQKKPKRTVYTDRTGEKYEISNGKGKVMPTEEVSIPVRKIGYFSYETIVKLALEFKEKTGRKPTLTDLAGDLFMSPQLGDEEGGRVVYLNENKGKYFRSKRIIGITIIEQ